MSDSFSQKKLWFSVVFVATIDIVTTVIGIYFTPLVEMNPLVVNEPIVSLFMIKSLIIILSYIGSQMMKTKSLPPVTLILVWGTVSCWNSFLLLYYFI